jgi:cyclophilin family peptidyl-prolyl cis-trans isomerase
MAAVLILAACGKNNTEEGLAGENAGEVFDTISVGRENIDGTIYERLRDAPAKTLQLEPLTKGEELAVMHTNYGDITLRFFPEEAPLAVENFITQAKNGFYDGLVFHRVIDGFMIQGGCPNGAGNGGESIYREGLGLERSFNLHHFRGALAAAHSGPGRTIGTQFYIVQSPQITQSMAEYFRFLTTVQDETAGEFSDGRHIYVRDVWNTDMLEHFINHGGTTHLDWQWNNGGYGHTVFGHVVSGMETVDSIAGTETMRERPIEDVIIESISFIVYE